MTVRNITTTENVTRTVVDKVTKVAGVEYQSDSSNRGMRITPSSSMPGRFTLTVANPDGSDEKAIVLKKEDMVAFLTSGLKYVRGY